MILEFAYWMFVRFWPTAKGRKYSSVCEPKPTEYQRLPRALFKSACVRVLSPLISCDRSTIIDWSWGVLHGAHKQFALITLGRELITNGLNGISRKTQLTSTVIFGCYVWERSGNYRSGSRNCRLPTGTFFWGTLLSIYSTLGLQGEW